VLRDKVYAVEKFCHERHPAEEAEVVTPPQRIGLGAEAFYDKFNHHRFYLAPITTVINQKNSMTSFFIQPQLLVL
jgi:hypothetical protein